MWHSRPPRDPPTFMANTILNFHFDYWHPSLILTWQKPTYIRAPEQPSRQVEREDDSERRNQQQPGCHWYHQH